MSSWILFAAAAPAGESVPQQLAHQFGWTPALFLSQVITFVIVAVALKKFAYGPLLKVLDDRKQRIAEGLANADKIKIELANAQAKTQELLTQASNQANQINEEARAAAAKVTETETQKAVAAAQDIKPNQFVKRMKRNKLAKNQKVFLTNCAPSSPSRKL